MMVLLTILISLILLLPLIDGFGPSSIVPGRVNADSPLDTTLFVEITDALRFLQKWMGKSGLENAAADHAHQGFAIDGTSAVPGASAGVSLVVGASHGGSRFKPLLVWATDPTTATDIVIKMDGNTVGAARILSTSVFGAVTGFSRMGLGGIAGTFRDLQSLQFKDAPGMIKTATYVGTGSAQSITGVGFQPEVLIIMNKDVTNRGTVVRVAAHTGNNSMEMHTGNESTTAITALDSDGFTISTNNNVSADTEVYRYLALKSGTVEGESIQIETYTGSGVTGKVITNSAGFPAQCILTIGAGLNVSPVLAFLANQTQGKLTPSSSLVTACENWTESTIVLTANTSINPSGGAMTMIFFSGGTRP